MSQMGTGSVTSLKSAVFNADIFHYDPHMASKQ